MHDCPLPLQERRRSVVFTGLQDWQCRSRAGAVQEQCRSSGGAMREGLLATFLAGVGESSIVKSASTPPHSIPICRNHINLDLKMGQTRDKLAHK